MNYPNTQLFINGQWCDAAAGESLAVFNPATGKGDRVGIKEVDGRNVRVFRSSGEPVGANEDYLRHKPHRYPYLMADPACPHLAPWSPAQEKP